MAVKLQAEEIARVWQERQARLHRAARMILRDDTDAEDCVQEALLLALRHRAKFDGRAGSSVLTWLVCIVRNKARDVLRKRRVRPDQWNAAALASFVYELSSAEPTAETRLLVEEQQHQVRRAVAGLAPKMRDAIVRKYWNDELVRESAARLGVPESTFKVRLVRSRVRLSRALAGRL